MYEYIKGTIAELSPTEVIIESNNLGYKILISLQTYSNLTLGEQCKLYLHHHLREDIELLFGFFDKEERSLFENLIEVSGIGPNTARMMLSSLNTQEITAAILSGDVNKLKSIKGIGLKTAQRLLIDLKDKIGKGSGVSSGEFIIPGSSPHRQEAVSALIMLGFNKTAVEKIVDIVIKEGPEASIEEIIKRSLKRL